MRDRRSKMKDKTRQQYYEVQWYHGHISVTRQSGLPPRPQTGQVLVRMTACGICGADIRAITGNKVITGDTHHHVTLGHEGVGRIVALGDGVSGFRKGDCVVILPHVLSSSRPDALVERDTQQVDPISIGRHKTLHMGWD